MRDPRRACGPGRPTVQRDSDCQDCQVALMFEDPSVRLQEQLSPQPQWNHGNTGSLARRVARATVSGAGVACRGSDQPHGLGTGPVWSGACVHV
eukprot:7628243-Alexandrium_andersonii.AAC.1